MINVIDIPYAPALIPAPEPPFNQDFRILSYVIAFSMLVHYIIIFYEILFYWKKEENKKKNIFKISISNFIIIIYVMIITSICNSYGLKFSAKKGMMILFFIVGIIFPMGIQIIIIHRIKRKEKTKKCQE